LFDKYIVLKNSQKEKRKQSRKLLFLVC